MAVTDAVLDSITVSPASSSIAKGLTQQFTANGTYSDLSTQNITANVTWVSSNTTVATISDTGLATAFNVGSTTIMTTQGEINGNTTLTVGPKELISVTVSPADVSIPEGCSQQFTANGTYSDGTYADLTSSATWTSSDTMVTTIDSTGLATAINTGSTIIRATFGETNGIAFFDVTPAEPAGLSVTPVSPSLAMGRNLWFNALVSYTDGSLVEKTGSCTWTSSDTTVATISSTTGRATALNVGITTITASFGDVSGNATLTVLPAEPGANRCFTGQPIPAFYLRP